MQVVRWEKSEPPNKVFIEKELRAEGYRTELWVDRPGTSYRDYRHDRDEIVWVLQGEAQVEIASETEKLGSGDRVFIPKGMKHSLTVLGDRTLYWLAAFKK